MKTMSKFELVDINKLIPYINNARSHSPEQTSEQPVCYYDENTLYRITYVLKNVPQYGLDKDYCILGIRKIQ